YAPRGLPPSESRLARQPGDGLPRHATWKTGPIVGRVDRELDGVRWGTGRGGSDGDREDPPSSGDAPSVRVQAFLENRAPAGGDPPIRAQHRDVQPGTVEGGPRRDIHGERAGPHRDAGDAVVQILHQVVKRPARVVTPPPACLGELDRIDPERR